MNKQTITTALLALIAMAGQGQIKCHVDNSRGDRHLGYSSRHTQVPVPATISPPPPMLRNWSRSLRKH